MLKSVWSVKVLKNGRITIPNSVRDLYNIKDGEWLEFVLEAGEIKIIKKDDDK